MAYRFPKHMRLCGSMRISQLYREGKRFVVWPFRVSYQPTEGETKVLVWAPKSLFKKAVQRNHMRRLMREAYRLHQDLLGDGHYLIAINYIDKEEQAFAVVEKSICKILKKIHSSE